MTDLSATVAPKSDQINADDLIAGPRTIRVTRVTGNEGNPEQPVNIFFEGDMGKPYRPCKSMRRVLIAVWGADGNAYTGRSMTLYRDPAVSFGGMQVGGIRISHMTGIDKPVTMALTASKANRKPYTVKPLSDAPAPSADPVAAQARARAAASSGTAAFTAWWNSDAGKADRGHCRGILDDLRALCAAADAPPADGPHWTDTAPDDGFPGGDAWTAGEAAFRAGQSARTCPHEQGTQDAADWLGAWHGARRAAE